MVAQLRVVVKQKEGQFDTAGDYGPGALLSMAAHRRREAFRQALEEGTGDLAVLRVRLEQHAKDRTHDRERRLGLLKLAGETDRLRIKVVAVLQAYWPVPDDSGRPKGGPGRGRAA